MRLIYFLVGGLFLANLVLLLLPSEQQRLNQGFSGAVEIAPDRIRLLSDGVAASNARAPLVSGESESPKIGSEVAAYDSAISTVSDSDDLSSVIDGKCYRVGPFLHSSRLSLAKAKLNNMGVLYTVEKRESTPAEVFRVFVGPFTTDARGRSVRQELTEQGIYDHFQKQDSDGQYIVSLGIYSRRPTADASRERFSGRNINARVRQEETVLPDSFWLSLLARQVDGLPLDVLGKVDWGEYSAQFGAYECQV